MAYVAKKDSSSQYDPEAERDNPYDALAQGGMTAQAVPQPYSATPAMTGTVMPQVVSATPLMNASGPTASGHVNFDSLYNANAGVAQREAGKRNEAAQKAAQGAQQGLTGLQGQFTSRLTGATTQAPTERQQAWAQYGSTNVTQPKKVTQATYTPTGQTNVTGGDQNTVTEEQEGLVSTPPPLTGTGYTPTPVSRGLIQEARGAGVPAGTDPEAEVRAGASHQFDGPGSLSDMEQYQKLLQDTTAAQDEINNPFTDLGRTDSALLGAAGRPRSAELQQQYGDLQGNLDRANTASIKQSADAKATSDANRKAYEDLASQYDTRVGADQKMAADANKSSDAVIAKAHEDAVNAGNAGPSGPWTEGSTTTTTNPDGSKEQTWTPGMEDAGAKALGATEDYDTARSTSNTYAQMWSKDFGISMDDADFVRSTMTAEDWTAYQQAARRGPDAVKKWINGILARRKK